MTTATTIYTIDGYVINGLPINDGLGGSAPVVGGMNCTVVDCREVIATITIAFDPAKAANIENWSLSSGFVTAIQPLGNAAYLVRTTRLFTGVAYTLVVNA